MYKNLAEIKKAGGIWQALGETLVGFCVCGESLGNVSGSWRNEKYIPRKSETPAMGKGDSTMSEKPQVVLDDLNENEKDEVIRRGMAAMQQEATSIRNKKNLPALMQEYQEKLAKIRRGDVRAVHRLKTEYRSKGLKI